MQRTWSAAYWLVSHGLLNLFSYNTQNQSATYNGMGPSSSLVKKTPYQPAYSQILQGQFLI